MDEQRDLLERITADRLIFDGKLITRGMRISVELILNQLARGETVQSILVEYPSWNPVTSVRAWLTRTQSRLMP